MSEHDGDDAHGGESADDALGMTSRLEHPAAHDWPPPADAHPHAADVGIEPDDPTELHFPGDVHEAGAHAVGDGSTGWPDDDHFAQWLREHGGDDQDHDEASAAQLREALSPPPVPGLPSPEALVDWALRQTRD